jgi:hypothetical protein
MIWKRSKRVSIQDTRFFYGLFYYQQEISVADKENDLLFYLPELTIIETLITE